ncbi:MAG: hypothetical protein GWP09_02585 [Nitrospiraceae bacterium]|nr:hypothetical protein [Nitrospiraceae bacterium]
MNSCVFDNPKSINLLKKIIKFTTSKDDIILNYFAGSGSTAEAVMQINREENSNRRFILCEQMDYVENVTAKRIQKCLEGENFIYSELTKLNQQYSELIDNSTSIDELQQVWEKLKKEAFISWRVNISKVDELLPTASIDSLNDIKSLINETLDKNQLYVLLSEINGQDYLIQPFEQDLNFQFTKLKM